MFQSFTGSSRRPRQVDLSGRRSNPFSAFPSSTQSASAGGTQNTIAHAHQERLHRQQERERLNAAKRIQRTWRGASCRDKFRRDLRREWDRTERSRSSRPLAFDDSDSNLRIAPLPYRSKEECEDALRLFVQFFQVSSGGDLQRLSWFLEAVQGNLGIFADSLGRQSTYLWLRFTRKVLRVLKADLESASFETPLHDILLFLAAIPEYIPRPLTGYAGDFYDGLSHVMRQVRTQDVSSEGVVELVFNAVISLLRPITADTLLAYEGFARNFLTIMEIADHPEQLERLAESINYKLLAKAIALLLNPGSSALAAYLPDGDTRLWLLSYCIFFHGHAYRGARSAQKVESDHLRAISLLLASVVNIIVSRINLDTRVYAYQRPSGSVKQQSLKPLPPFVKNEIETLIDKDSITGLLSQLDGVNILDGDVSMEDNDSAEEPKLVASYVLTLLRVFPKRADDLRLWLFMSSTSTDISGPHGNNERLPAIKYFSKAVMHTNVYKAIKQDSRNAVDLLKSEETVTRRGNGRRHPSNEEKPREWQIIILFMELYSFVLRLTDDEEFFSPATAYTIPDQKARFSRTKESALPLDDVKHLTLFLKNLAFALYWNSSDILETKEDEEPDSLASYFSTSASFQRPQTAENKTDTNFQTIAGVLGMSIDYLKGLVTGLLRAIYERDSRRRFLPQGHWLMTSRFDMEGFIPAVVSEEESWHLVEESNEEGVLDHREYEDDDADADEDEDEDEYNEADLESAMVGNSRIQQLRRTVRLQQLQRMASRKRYLEAVAPRLEILQNMPFFIPFETRVQIFREFVTLDQLRRRNGYLDPDTWRLHVAHRSTFDEFNDPLSVSLLEKHHAKIRRECVFEDAFNQFYSLGEGLKEPIQISFVDQFNTVEAGIDGGGVTKEFLTSITSEAFNPENEMKYFVENDQHLLYPNPAAVDQLKESLRELGVREGSDQWSEHIRNLLRRYEFLGRVIGKCLYEGILVDLTFAGFFLLKWALTGGSGSASKESGYRANLNDLRELDKELYQGLLQLKDYSGNVEDFSLDFTVTDVVFQGKDGEPSKNVTRDLIPNGSKTAVTNENRLIYISEMARHRLQRQPYYQTSAFLRGLGSIIQPSWLSMYNQIELQTLVGGASTEIDVEDLRANTLYGGIYVIGDDHLEHPTVELFWKAMHSFSDVDRRKVLKFVTSTPRAPLLGFSQLKPHFSIRDAGSDETRLPSTSTCVNLLKLPRYAKYETLREKLLYSINSGAGFDLS